MDKGLDGAGFGDNQAAPGAPTEASNGAASPAHLRLMNDYLSVRGIPADLADTAGIYAVANARSEIDPQFDPVPAIIFPYRTLDGELDLIQIDEAELPFYRVRYLGEPPSGFIKRKSPRFGQLKGSGVHVYLPPLFDWRVIATDPSIHLVITEGECKALSLAARDVPAIGLGGVDAIWRRIDEYHREFHPLLAALKWGSREVAIVFDSDIAEKPNVLAAERRLIEQLTLRGAIVRPVRLSAGAAP